MMKESGSGGRRLQAVGEGVNLGDSGGVSTMVGMADKGDDMVRANMLCDGRCGVEMRFFWCWRGCSSQSKIAHHGLPPTL